MLEMFHNARFRDLLRIWKSFSVDNLVPMMLTWNGRYRVSPRRIFELLW